MTPSDSDWINDLFAGGARDWTPAAARHATRLLFMPIVDDPEASHRCSSILSGDERGQAERFLTEDGRRRFTQRRAFRRYCGALALGSPHPLSLVEFAESEKGRPLLREAPHLSFSFSSCRLGYLGAWSLSHDIGVDIEDRTRTVEAAELSQRFFSKTEANAVSSTAEPQRMQDFFRLWTLKEAALKSIGEGLPFGLDAFAFELTPDPRVRHVPKGYGGTELFHPHTIEDGALCAAMVTWQRARSMNDATRSPSLAV